MRSRGTVVPLLFSAEAPYISVSSFSFGVLFAVPFDGHVFRTGEALGVHGPATRNRLSTVVEAISVISPPIAPWDSGFSIPLEATQTGGAMVVLVAVSLALGALFTGGAPFLARLDHLQKVHHAWATIRIDANARVRLLIDVTNTDDRWADFTLPQHACGGATFLSMNYLMVGVTFWDWASHAGGATSARTAFSLETKPTRFNPWTGVSTGNLIARHTFGATI